MTLRKPLSPVRRAPTALLPAPAFAASTTRESNSFPLPFSLILLASPVTGLMMDVPFTSLHGELHERRSNRHRTPEPRFEKRADGDQPVLPAFAHAQELGLSKAGRQGVRRIHRRDEACGRSDRAHTFPRRTAEPAGPWQAAHRRGRAGSAAKRPGPGAGCAR